MSPCPPERLKQLATGHMDGDAEEPGTPEVLNVRPWSDFLQSDDLRDLLPLDPAPNPPSIEDFTVSAPLVPIEGSNGTSGMLGSALTSATALPPAIGLDGRLARLPVPVLPMVVRPPVPMFPSLALPNRLVRSRSSSPMTRSRSERSPSPVKVRLETRCLST